MHQLILRRQIRPFKAQVQAPFLHKRPAIESWVCTLAIDADSAVYPAIPIPSGHQIVVTNDQCTSATGEQWIRGTKDQPNNKSIYLLNSVSVNQ